MSESLMSSKFSFMYGGESIVVDLTRFHSISQVGFVTASRLLDEAVKLMTDLAVAIPSFEGYHAKNKTAIILHYEMTLTGGMTAKGDPKPPTATSVTTAVQGDDRYLTTRIPRDQLLKSYDALTKIIPILRAQVDKEYAAENFSASNRKETT